MMKKKSNLIQIEIKNPNYGKVKSIPLYVTPQLKRELRQIKSERHGDLFQTLVMRGFRGGKHLLEIVRDAVGNNVNVVLSHKKTELDGRIVTINFNDYQKFGSKTFYRVYRETGLQTAQNFLINESMYTTM